MKKLLSLALLAIPGIAQQPQYLGRLSPNPYSLDSISSSYSAYDNAYSPTSVDDPFGAHASPFSPRSVNDPYIINVPRLYGADGTHLGTFSANRVDPDFTSNPYLGMASPFSGSSTNNSFSTYGTGCSKMSARNRFAIQAPRIVARPIF